MIEFFERLAGDDDGATAVEYGLILALLFLAILGAVQALGQKTIVMWSNTADTVNEVTTS